MALAKYPLRKNLIRNFKKTSTLKMNYSVVCADRLSIDSIRLHETTRIYLFDAKTLQKWKEMHCSLNTIRREPIYVLFFLFFLSHMMIIT